MLFHGAVGLNDAGVVRRSAHQSINRLITKTESSFLRLNLVLRPSHWLTSCVIHHSASRGERNHPRAILANHPIYVQLSGYQTAISLPPLGNGTEPAILAGLKTEFMYGKLSQLSRESIAGR